MKPDFINLLSHDFDNDYLSYMEGLFGPIGCYGSLVHSFQALDLLSREVALKQTLFNFLPKNGYKDFANPFFIGFGNPNSQILVIGKELAFQADNADLLIKESINNYRQWKIIVDNNLFLPDQQTVASSIGFSPLLPKAFHTGATGLNSTWGVTSKIIHGVYPDQKSSLLLNELQSIDNSFFNKCFLSELNYFPSKKHEGTGLSSVRKPLLEHAFFKSFPIVIFSAKSYLSGKSNATIISSMFNAKYQSTFALDKIGNKRPLTLSVDIYKSSQQSIFVCNQLSGQAAWSTAALTEFSKLITERL